MEPEEEASAVQDLIAHWQSYRVSGKRVRMSSVPLPELYAECLGFRTTLFGPGVMFKTGSGEFHILAPGPHGHWYDVTEDYRCIGTLVRIGLVK